jgi:adenylate cyclase, class 2
VSAGLILSSMSLLEEREIKFRIKSLESLAARLRPLGFERVTPRTHEINILFDLPGKPLARRGELLRLRQYGPSWVLTHKAKANRGGPHKVRIETETRVEDGEKMEAILRALGFKPCFRYEKFRAEWRHPQGLVVIDETPIGNFAEIEGPAEWIDSVARNLGVEAGDYLTETYAALFMAWKTETGSSAKDMTFRAIDPSAAGQ